MKIFKDPVTFNAILGFSMLVYSAIQAYFGLNTYALITAMGAWAIYLGMHLADIQKEIRRFSVKTISDMILYRDKEGKPLTLDQWSVLFNHPKYRIVKEDIVGKYTISTQWMGVWHYGDTFFETVIIDTTQEDGSITQSVKYKTLQQAQLSHDLLVQQYLIEEGRAKECNG